MDNEALARYKYYLCRRFLEKLVGDKLITEQQLIKIEKIIVGKLASEV